MKLKPKISEFGRYFKCSKVEKIIRLNEGYNEVRAWKDSKEHKSDCKEAKRLKNQLSKYMHPDKLRRYYGNRLSAEDKKELNDQLVELNNNLDYACSKK